METGDKLFQWLVDYHCRHNLPAVLHHVQQGVSYNISGQRLAEGHENPYYHGFLIIANGTTLADRLFQDRVVIDEEVEGFVPLPSKRTLFEYLGKQQDNDGAYIYDSVNRQMTRVYELNNNPAALQRPRLVEMVPADFVTYDGTVLPAARNLGTKTRLAIKLPQTYDQVDTFQIKRSAYTALGMGKVTHFDHEGLVEEFFLDYRPQSTRPFISRNHGIVGVYRRYRDDEGSPVHSENILVPHRELVVDRKLAPQLRKAA